MGKGWDFQQPFLVDLRYLDEAKSAIELVTMLREVEFNLAPWTGPWDSLLPSLGQRVISESQFFRFGRS